MMNCVPTRRITGARRSGGSAVAALRDALHAEAGEGFPSEAAARAALDTVSGYASLVRRDARATARLEARARRRGCFWRCVPELPRDVHDLDGLARVEACVFEGGGAQT